MRDIQGSFCPWPSYNSHPPPHSESDDCERGEGRIAKGRKNLVGVPDVKLSRTLNLSANLKR
jgi:hypothetical protein